MSSSSDSSTTLLLAENGDAPVGLLNHFITFMKTAPSNSDDFIFRFEAKTLEDLTRIDTDADFAAVFGYQDKDNYNYVLKKSGNILEVYVDLDPPPVPPSVPPKIYVTVPSEPHIAPATINLSANATTGSGVITKVEFFYVGSSEPIASVPGKTRFRSIEIVQFLEGCAYFGECELATNFS